MREWIYGNDIFRKIPKAEISLFIGDELTITANQIRLIFTQTTVSSRVESLEDCLADVNGELINGLHEIFTNFEDISNYSSILIHADGGVRDFFLIYKMGKYPIIIKRFTWPINDFYPTNAEGLSNWLNDEERKIKANAVLELL